jgi:hypothetical protein
MGDSLIDIITNYNGDEPREVINDLNRHIYNNRGADIDEIVVGHTPLTYATIVKNDLEIIKLLINRGANINKLNGVGETALHEAVKINNIDIIKFLIDNGADVNIGTKSPLHYAMHYSDPTIAQMLINKGAYVNYKDSKGITPLEFLINRVELNKLQKPESLICILINNGAIVPDKYKDKYFCNQGNKKAVYVHEEIDNEKIKWLMDNGKDITEKIARDILKSIKEGVPMQTCGGDKLLINKFKKEFGMMYGRKKKRSKKNKKRSKKNKKRSKKRR